jgi:beta-aspartyl-peptidase (threonine type)
MKCKRLLTYFILGFVALSFGRYAIAPAGDPAVKPTPGAKKVSDPKTVLVMHGGAGVLSAAEMAEEKLTRADYEKVLAQALAVGYGVLRQEGKMSVDAVEAAIRVLEDCELFNAGRGAALTHDGRAELDASIMEGRAEATAAERLQGKNDPRKRAGAVAGVGHIKNPISAARAVMEMKNQRHALLSGEGAEWFCLSEPIRKQYAIERVSNVYFWTDRRLRQIRESAKAEEARRAQSGGADRYFGTVGAVALDGAGHLAAGTSTGGLTNKLPGRIGDSPIIGAGTYADDRACGVSCTGTGEVFIRHVVAHDVAARMLYGKLNVEEAAQATIKELPDEEGGIGGLIALDAHGRHAFAMSPQSDGMYRGYVTEAGDIYVAIYAKDQVKRLGRATKDGKLAAE